MTMYQHLQTRLPAELHSWLVTGVAHHQFKAMGAAAIRALGKPGHVLYDLKYLLPAADSDLRL